MSATLENNIKFGVVIIVVALCSFWQNMEGYQKDRVATVIVRSAENLVNQCTCQAAEQMVHTMLVIIRSVS